MTSFSDLVPIFRIFDVAKALEFYRDYLGMAVAWEHRFEPSLPLYMEVRRDGLVLHLSEHYGDALPGSTIRVKAGESIYIPGGLKHNEIATSDDFEILEVSVPADMGTEACDPPAGFKG